MDATIVDLRYRMKDVLRAIDRGEAVTVLYRGKAKATLIPISPGSESSGKRGARTEDQSLFGLWRDREDLKDPGAWLRKLREPRDFVAQTGKKVRAARKAR